MLKDLIKTLQAAGDKKKSVSVAAYFKTGKGQYGEGDIFLGITVPEQRKIAHKFLELPLSDVVLLLRQNIHEYRFTALEILVAQYERAVTIGDEKLQKKIVDVYLANTAYVNNWDLVDTSAREIVGHYFFNRERKILYKLARSSSLWERRIAIVATHYFIMKEDYADTMKISEMLLTDTHDLIHKASGWMLREIGKRSRATLITFLDTHHKIMPRTMLRYSIEHFTPELRRKYLMK